MNKPLPQIAFNFLTEPEQPSAVPAQDHGLASESGQYPVGNIEEQPDLPIEAMAVEASAIEARSIETRADEARLEEALAIETRPVDIPAGVGVRLKAMKNEAPVPVPDLPVAEGSEKPDAGRETLVSPAPARVVKSKRGRKSLKQVTAEADLIDIPEDEDLFQKQYYTMGEVADMFRVNQSLLRFWETEFSILQPRKNKKGDRHFRPVDIKNLHLIYHLLRQRKYTIEGAKEFLKKNKKAEERFEAIRRLQQVKAFLLEWKAQL
jgi:DNA-binding transcriptional MerR regulator